MEFDFYNQSLGKDKNGKEIYLKDIWPSNKEIEETLRNSLSAEKLFEKYTSLAKEAMSSGDKTLSENYLQHADHFMRVIDEKNKSRVGVENKISENNKPIENKQELPESNHTTQSNNSEKKS